MSNPHITDLRQHLMATLANLRDRENPMEPDRARAIVQTLAQAQTADVVLLAGKGHEDYQEIAGQRLPFSDLTQVRHALGLIPANRETQP